ncbi:acetyl-CoA C-acetyltransferase [bacterium]|jgi:acetyl-CoA acetyltransferase family protein|nr:acetyl-CoA C-acetyltransferase [bacterium]
MSNPSLVFLSGKRTPFGANGGALRDVNPVDLAVAACKAALEQAHVSPEQINHVIIGNILASAPEFLYLPRHVGLKVGVPQAVPSLGLNRLCGTGFQAIVDASQQMIAGDTEVALVGGVENMSMAPYLLRNVRWGAKMGHFQTTDLLMESLNDTYAQAMMAITAENLAVDYKISREESDEFSLRSQKLYSQAAHDGRFTDELTPFPIKDRKGNVVNFEKDEHPRPETTAEGLAKLKPVFKKDGVVTAGAASGIVDGAAAMVVATEQRAKKEGWKPLGRLVSYGIAGCDPKIMGIGPVPASQIALKKAGMTLDQMDLIEVNEAFAPQTLAVQKALKIPMEKLNTNGGAIAVGHPLGATGVRITQTLLYQLRRSKKRYGLASACIGGGQGIALVLEAF